MRASRRDDLPTAVGDLKGRRNLALAPRPGVTPPAPVRGEGRRCLHFVLAWLLGVLILVGFIALAAWGPKMSQKDIDETILIKSVLGL